MGATYIWWDPRRIDACLSDSLYEQQWRELLANRDHVRMIVLYSWNLYGEQAHIEPSSGCPASVGDRYVLRTQRYYQRFLAGSLMPTFAPGACCPSSLMLPLASKP
jgi:hypothetical protein